MKIKKLFQKNFKYQKLLNKTVFGVILRIKIYFGHLKTI